MKVYFLQRLFYLFATLLLLLQLSFIIYYQGISSHTSLMTAYLHFYQQLFNEIAISPLSTPTITQQWGMSFLFTLGLCLLSFLFSLLIGVPLGVITGLKQTHFYNNLLKILYLIAVTTPTLWIALLLVTLFDQHLVLLPSFSHYTAHNFHGSSIEFHLFNLWAHLNKSNVMHLIGLLKHLMLTLGVLILVPTAQIMQLSRVNTLLLTQQNYIQAAMIRGHSTFLLIHRHILRNLLPILWPKLYFTFPLILTLCLSIEALFGWPGMGSWALYAFYQHDYFIISLITLTLGSLNAVIYSFCELLQFMMCSKNSERQHVI